MQVIRPILNSYLPSLFYTDGIRIDPLHHRIPIICIQHLLYHIRSRYLLAPLLIPHQCRCRHSHITDHKYCQQPGDHLARLHRNLFHQSGEHRIHDLDPHHRGQSPEKAVQQIDPAAQIKGNRAVIPEYRAKSDLRDHAAQILIGTAQKRADGKDKKAALIPGSLQQYRGHHHIHTPDNAERPPDKTAAAHPHTGSDTAKQRFCNISQ